MLSNVCHLTMLLESETCEQITATATQRVQQVRCAKIGLSIEDVVESRVTDM